MKNINEYIVSRLAKPVSYSEIDMIYWHLEKMSHAELCSLNIALNNIYQSSSSEEGISYDWEIIERLTKNLKRRKIALEGGNKSIKQLLAELKNASSEDEKMDIGEELFERFEHQSFGDQKLIFKGLIKEGCMLQVYNLINDKWGEIFIKELERIWRRDDDNMFARYIVKFSSEEFLLKHIERLSMHKHLYPTLCIRLSNNPAFVIDNNMFDNKWDYRATMYKLGRGEEREVLRRDIFKLIEHAIHNAAISYDDIMVIHRSTEEKVRYISILLNRTVRYATFAMQHAELNEEIEYIYEWDSQNIRELYKSLDEWYEEHGEELTFRQLWFAYCEVAKRNFPSEHQSIGKHSEAKLLEQLQPMLDDMGFELYDSPIDTCIDKTPTPYNYYADDYPF